VLVLGRTRCEQKLTVSPTTKFSAGKKLSKYTVSRDALSLNNSLLIECADYAGPLLPDSLKESCDQVGCFSPTRVSVQWPSVLAFSAILFFLQAFSVARAHVQYVHENIDVGQTFRERAQRTGATVAGRTLLARVLPSAAPSESK